MIDKQAVHDELTRVRVTFRDFVAGASAADLARRSHGTRWTNRELLFHLLFGYLIVRRLMWLVKLLGRLPAGATRPFAALLDATTRPFDLMNYVGSWIGGRLFRPERMVVSMDRVTAKLARQLDRESGRSLGRGMRFPTRWDPFFREYMTVGELYHYPTEHFDFHARQLSL